MTKNFPGKWLQSLTIILAPLYIIRWHIGVPTTLLEVLILLTALFSAVEYFNDNKKSTLKTKFDLLILFFLVTALIATLVTPDLLGGLGILRAYFIEPAIFFYSLILTSKKEGIRYILNSLLISAFWLSLLALLQKVTHQYSLAPYELVQGRVSAVYNSANSLALYIGPISLICFALFTKAKNNKFLYLAAFLFFCLILVWTRSRGGLVAEVVSLVVFTYAASTTRLRVLKKYWVALPVIITLGITIFLYTSFKTYYSLPTVIESSKTQADTLKIRYYIWAATINMLRDNPVTGAGLNGFKDLYVSKYHLPQYSEAVQYPHNLFLTFWAETGILGLASFLLILVSAFSLLIKNLKRDVLFGAGLLGALTYIVIHGIVDVPYFKNDLSLEFFVLLALIERF